MLRLSRDPMTSNRHYTNEEIYDALRAANGNFMAAATALGCNRQVIKKRVEETPMLIDLVADFKDGVLDQAETNIYSAVLAGDQAASKFVLTTIGKERGFITRNEMTGAGGTDLSAGMRDVVGSMVDQIAERMAEAAAKKEG